MGVLIAAKRTAYRPAMTQPGDARDEVAETLRQKLPAALGSPSMPGTEGWALESVRVERFFGHPVVSVGLACGDRRHDFHLFPPGALEEPYYRDEHLDFVYIEDAQESRGRRDRAVIDQFVRWLGATFRSRARQLSPIATAEATPAAPAPPTPAELALLDALSSGLEAALRAGSLPALAGWALDGVALEPFRDRPTPTLRLSQGARSLRVQLLPGGSDPAAFFRTARFDVLYDDDERATGYTRDHAALEALVGWLDEAFPAAPADAAPPAPPRRPARPFDPAAPTPPDPELAGLLEAELAQAMQRGELPALERWSLGTVALAPFRGGEALTIHLAHGDRKQRLRLLPAGAEPEAFFRTARFDVLYDDDEKGSGFTQDHAALEAVVAWLGATFPADASLRRKAPAPPATEESRRAEADASAVGAALAEALAGGKLPELASYALEGVAVGTFRERAVPVVTLRQGERRLQLQLVPAGSMPDAFYEAARFDLFYSDDEWASAYGRYHDVFERLTRWLDEAFPSDESPAARERARRRAAKPSPDPALDALADALAARLRADLESGALALPDGWSFGAAAVEPQQGVAAVTARFARGAEAFVFRLLPTDPARAAYLRTPRFDVLYDSEAGDWQMQDSPLAKAFVPWLTAAFPADAPAT